MPRTTTGCRNCVRRRVRCDENLPACNNCRKQGLACGGKRNEMLFVRHLPPSELDKEFSAFSSDARTTRRLFGKSSRARRKHGATPRGSCIRSGENDIPCSIPVLDTETVHLNFLRTFLGQTLVFDRFKGVTETYMDVCLSACDQYPLSAAAIRLLASAYWAKRRRTSLDGARKEYGCVLEQLRRGIQQGSQENLFDTLATISTLILYEKIVATTSTGWVKHSVGIAKLIRNCGSHQFQSREMKSILRRCRYDIVIGSYIRREPCFLAEPDWQDLFRGGHDDRRATFQSLLRSFEKLTNIAHNASEYLSKRNDSPAMGEAIANQATSLLSGLDSWYTIWQAGFKHQPQVQQRNDKLGPNMTCSPSGTVIVYPTLLDAAGANICRCLKLNVLTWIHHVRNPLWTPGAYRERTAELPEIRFLANDVLRSIHHHFVTENSQLITVALQSLLFCLSICNKVFPLYSEEGQWLQALLDMIADENGYELARTLKKAEARKWSEYNLTGSRHVVFVEL